MGVDTAARCVMMAQWEWDTAQNAMRKDMQDQGGWETGGVRREIKRHDGTRD